MSSAADRLISRIQSLDTAAAENRQRAESYERMTGELKRVEVTVSSADGAVTVVAGPGGEVKSITFSDAIRTMDSAALSSTAQHTLSKARADVAKAQAEVVRDNLGDAELLDKVLNSDEKLFGDRPATDPGAAPRVPSSAPDDGEPYSVFQRKPTW